MNQNKFTRLIPRIFIPIERFSLSEVLLEQYPSFDIFWYHWPFDGYPLTLEEDYEPVVLIYNIKKEIGCIITRQHWDYQYYFSGIEQPLQILFDGSFHPAILKNGENIDIFEKKVESLKTVAYKPRIIQAREVSEKFRTGKGHITIVKKIVSNPLHLLYGVADPTVEAIRAYHAYCI